MPKRGRSSTQDDDSDDHAGDRPFKAQRACDNCRKKKTRCFGYQPGSRCHPCESVHAECTFSKAEKRIDPLQSRVQELESRLRQVEKVLTQILTGDETDVHAERRDRGSRMIHDSAEVQSSRPTLGADHLTKPPSERECRRSHSLDYVDKGTALSNEVDSVTFVSIEADGDEHRSKSTEHAHVRRRTDLHKDAVPFHFFGGASDLKIFPQIDRILGLDGDRLSAPNSTSLNSSPAFADIDTPATTQYDWPDPETQDRLVDIYFSHFNQHYPIINEVLFRRTRLDSRLWITSSSSKEDSMLFLGVMSTACRYLSSDDLSKQPDLAQKGRHWSSVLHHMLEHTATGANVTSVQIQTLLLSIFCQIACHDSAHTSWLNLAKCVRLLQSMGADRKFTAKANAFPLVIEETFRRLWWVTYLLDRMMSAHMGRPMCINDEDIDVDEILLVDDKYIVEASGSGTSPVQPKRILCSFSGFQQSVRLSKIVGIILRSIYAPSKANVEQDQREASVRKIDMALRKWLEGIPNHLTYSADQPNTDWLLQSSRLFLLYYYTQTLLHRPFVQMQQNSDLSMTLNAMNIVSNASRAGIHIVYNAAKRNMANMLGVETQLRTLTFGVFLLLISLSARGKGKIVPSGVIADIRKAIFSLRSVEQHWETAKIHADHLTLLLDRLLFTAPNDIQHSAQDQDTQINIGERSSAADVPNVDGHFPIEDEARLAGLKLPFTSSELQDYFHLFPGMAATPSSQLNTELDRFDTLPVVGEEPATAVPSLSPWLDDSVGRPKSLAGSSLTTTSLDSAPSSVTTGPILSNMSGQPSRLQQEVNNVGPPLLQNNTGTFDPLDALSTLDHLFSDTDWTHTLFQTHT